MRKLLLASSFALATLSIGAEARAWGLHSGDTIGLDDNMVYGEVGWPGITAGFAHGINDKLEVGGRLDMLYGVDGTTTSLFGMAFVGTIRFTLVRSTKYSVNLHIDPGFKFDELRKPLFFGLQFPIGIEAGYHVSRVATVSVGFDMPFFADFTNGGYFVIPPQVGPGFEYHLGEHFTTGLVTRFGGAVFAGGPRGESGFAFRTQGFFGYRM